MAHTYQDESRLYGNGEINRKFRSRHYATSLRWIDDSGFSFAVEGMFAQYATDYINDNGGDCTLQQVAKMVSVYHSSDKIRYVGTVELRNLFEEHHIGNGMIEEWVKESINAIYRQNEKAIQGI